MLALRIQANADSCNSEVGQQMVHVVRGHKSPNSLGWGTTPYTRVLSRLESSAHYDFQGIIFARQCRKSGRQKIPFEN